MQNQEPEFLIQKDTSRSKNIKHMCLTQNELFQQWVAQKQWYKFHTSHYDWWAFPIDQNSLTKGDDYKIGYEQQKILQKDRQFLNALMRNSILVCMSWGWDLQNGEYIKNKVSQQRWQKWPIRLSKMCRSLEIFQNGNPDIPNLFRNAIKYSILIIKQYGRQYYPKFNDLSGYFLQNMNKLSLQQQCQWTQHDEQKINVNVNLKSNKQVVRSNCCC